MRDVPRLVVLTCVWQRPELTKVVLESYRRMKLSLQERVELILLAVGSEGKKSRSLCTSQGFEYVEHPNDPLTYKWNAGVKAARAFDPDGLVMVGSDDLVTDTLFEACAEKLRAQHDFFGFTDIHVFDLATARLGYWGGYEHSSLQYRAGEPIGCGRCFSRRLLESTDWNLWPAEPRLNAKLDWLALNYLALKGFVPESWPLDEFAARAVDIKSATNINSFASFDFLTVEEGEPAWRFLEPLLDCTQLVRLKALHAIESARVSPSLAHSIKTDGAAVSGDSPPQGDLPDEFLVWLEQLRASVTAEDR